MNYCNLKKIKIIGLFIQTISLNKIRGKSIQSQKIFFTKKSTPKSLTQHILHRELNTTNKNNIL